MTQFITKLAEISRLDQAERMRLENVAIKYAFRSNEYYLSLIDWNDPDDPIRRLILPHPGELEEWGRLDPSDEKAYTRIAGLEHKYNSTVLLLVSNVCGGICRFCFRKRVFLDGSRGSEVLRDLDAALDYIRQHTEVTNVLLTGGDPLMLTTEKLDRMISELRRIEHVRIIRIGSKMPAFNPHRIIDDPALLEMINRHTLPDRKIYVMTHFNHPRELTDAAISGCNLLGRAGALLANQTPMIRGVNDRPEVLAELFRKLSFVGVPPYYVFQCRPAVANKAYAVPIEEGYQIFERAKALVSGLAKRARFVMSHATGKIEIIGLAHDRVYFKYHRAANDGDSGRFLAYQRNGDAFWFDDYEETVRDYPVTEPYRLHGPE